MSTKRTIGLFVLLAFMVTALMANPITASVESSPPVDPSSAEVAPTLQGTITPIDGDASTPQKKEAETAQNMEHAPAGDAPVNEPSDTADTSPNNPSDTKKSAEADTGGDMPGSENTAEPPHGKQVDTESLGELVRHVSGQYVAAMMQDVRNDLRKDLTAHIHKTVDQELDEHPGNADQTKHEIREWIKNEYGASAMSDEEIRDALEAAKAGTMTEDEVQQHISAVMEERNEELLHRVDKRISERTEKQDQQLKTWLEKKIPEDRYDELENRLTQLEGDSHPSDRKQVKKELKQWLKPQIPSDRLDELDSRIDAVETKAAQNNDSGLSKAERKELLDAARAYTDEKTGKQATQKQLDAIQEQVDTLTDVAVDVDGFKQWVQQQNQDTLHESRAYTDEQQKALKNWVKEQIDEQEPKNTVPDHDHPEYVTHDDLEQVKQENVSPPEMVDEDRIVDQVKQYVDRQTSGIGNVLTAGQLERELRSFRNWVDNRYATKEEVEQLKQQNRQIRKELHYLQAETGYTRPDSDLAAQVMAEHNYTQLRYGDTRCDLYDYQNAGKRVQCVR